MNDLDYGIHASIGRGPLGRTYRATRSDGVEVALKVLSPDAISELDLDHLRDVLGGLERVHHHAVPRHSTLFDYRGDLVLSHAFVDGFDVGSLVAVCALPARAAVQVAAEAAGALVSVAGARDEQGELLGLSHGDLKPSSILLRDDGDVAVIGFGQGRMTDQYRDRTLTRFVESVGFMAPERMDNEQSATSDVYSLALCLFHMVTGEIPMRTSANPRRHEARAADSVALLRAVLPEHEHAIVELVEQALAYDPADRPSAQEFGRRCAALVEELEGPRLREWAAEWVPVVRAADAEVPFVDDGSRLSSAVPDQPLAMEPMTLSPAPTSRRVSGETARPRVSRNLWLGLAGAALLVMAVAFLAARLV